MRRKLTALTAADLEIIETAASDPGVLASGVTPGLLVDMVLLRDVSRMTDPQWEALMSWQAKFLLHIKAQEAFDNIMADKPLEGLFFGHAKKRSTSTPSGNLPPAGEPEAGAGGSSAGGPGDQSEQGGLHGRTNRPQ